MGKGFGSHCAGTLLEKPPWKAAGAPAAINPAGGTRRREVPREPEPTGEIGSSIANAAFLQGSVHRGRWASTPQGANEDIGDPGNEQSPWTEKRDGAGEESKESKALPGTNSCVSEKEGLG